jgi:hypothetical protein
MDLTSVLTKDCEEDALLDATENKANFKRGACS